MILVEQRCPGAIKNVGADPRDRAAYAAVAGDDNRAQTKGATIGFYVEQIVQEARASEAVWKRAEARFAAPARSPTRPPTE